MKSRALSLSLLLAGSMLCFAASNGAWLQKVPQADREQMNPYAGKAEAIGAGGNLYRENCAKCHGEDAEGRAGRPSLRSERLTTATDGEIAWMIRNGQIFRGMPSWDALPGQERWQIVAYLRSLNPPEPHR